MPMSAENQWILERISLVFCGAGIAVTHPQFLCREVSYRRTDSLDLVFRLSIFIYMAAYRPGIVNMVAHNRDNPGQRNFLIFPKQAGCSIKPGYGAHMSRDCPGIVGESHFHIFSFCLLHSDWCALSSCLLRR